VGQESQGRVTFVLECVECGAHSDGHASGWRAYLDDDAVEVWTYCPACAEREFGLA
jgi:ribosomal protein L44E